MNRDEIKRIQQLCALIAIEKDRAKFTKLVEELNRILSAKGFNVADPPKSATRF
jgi:hypothetical protein